jgi:hypothetical protein
VRALLGRLLDVRLGAAPRHQAIDRLDHEVEDDEGDDQERDQRVDERAVEERAAVDVERQAREIGLPADRRDQRRDDVGDEGRDDGREGKADHDGDRQVDEVAAQQELPEVLHRSSNRFSKHRLSSRESYGG